MTEVSRKVLKGKGSKGGNTFKVIYQCVNVSCKEKGQKRSFLDDGMMVIPLSDA